MIQAVFYANPDTDLPIINDTRLLTQAGYRASLKTWLFWIRHGFSLRKTAQ